MIILVGKTCSGKSSVAEILRTRYGYERIVTYTTRPPRENERNGVEYHFISQEEFERLKSEDFFFETTSYDVASGETWYYGTPKYALKNGSCIVMNPEGMKKVKKMLDPDAYDIKVIYLNTSEAMIWNRLRQRGDSSDEASRRIDSDALDFESIDNYYDVAITTDSHNPEEIASIINAVIYTYWYMTNTTIMDT